MFWAYKSDISSTLALPWLATGQDYEVVVTLVIEEGEVFSSSFLALLNPKHIGRIWIKRCSDPDFKAVGSYPDPNCFLGYLAGPQSVDLDVKVGFPVGTESASEIISVQLFQGFQIPCPGDIACDEDLPLYADTEAELPLSRDSSLSCPGWQTGSICVKNEYDRADPGEELEFRDWLYLDSNRQVKKAFAGATPDTNAVVGVISDNAVNYQARLDSAVAGDGGYYIYCHGGVVDSAVVDAMVRLNWQTKLWFALPSGGGARKMHAAFFYNGDLFFWGGVDGSGNFLNSLYRFHPGDLTYSEVSTGGTARALHAAIVLGSDVAFVGGVNESGVVRTVDIVGLESGRWFEGVPAPEAFSTLEISVSPLKRPYWQVVNGTLFYGDYRAGRTRKFWKFG